MKAIKKLSALLLAVLLLASMSATALAAEEFGYDPVEGDGTTFTFTKFLVLDVNANVPNVEFEFEIEAADEVEADPGSTMAILPGPTPEDVELGTAVFGPESYDEGDSTDIDVVEKYDTDTQKYVKVSVSADFSQVEFDEPGVYRYILTEVDPKTDGFTADSESRVLDVYVSDVEGKLEVTAYVLHSEEDDIAVGDDYGSEGGELVDKNDGFTNEYTTYDLTFSKEVSGNQASKDKFFKFTVTIDDIPGNVLTVDIDEAVDSVTGNSATNSDYVGEENPDELTVDESGAVEATFYLQHGQSITIYGLTENAAYTVEEDAEDYLSNEPDNAEGTMEDDVTVEFVNTRNGVIPTGVMLTVVPGVVIVAIAAAGLILLSRKKKNNA